MSSVDVGSVAYRQDFEAICDVSENDPVLANPQPIAALPFAVHRFNVSRIGFAEVGDAFENGGATARSIARNCARASGVKGKRTAYSLPRSFSTMSP
jgi:hypothetical protein